MEELKEYQSLMSDFCDINDINLAEKLKKVPSQKHFWNTQLIDAKITLMKLEKEKKRQFKKEALNIVETSEVQLNKTQLVKEVEAKLEDIKEKIEDQKILIEWLELTTKTVSFMAQDFKNIISLKQIEEF